jgi:hypothetical protein
MKDQKVPRGFFPNLALVSRGTKNEKEFVGVANAGCWIAYVYESRD